MKNTFSIKALEKEDMNIVFVGHVDHGKSTIVGRLLADTHSLPEGKLEQVKENCKHNSKPFEYAFLLDALKDEQAQGITIDAARCFFQTDKRRYIIIDAPGHIEFLKNMVTGASRAEAALLVIDANEGVRENSKRHGYMLSMLGIKQVAILVNKMDLVDYSEDTFNVIVEEYTEFLKQINIEAETFIPVSGMMGDNVAHSSEKMSWYKGKTVLEQLDAFRVEKHPEDLPFRMSVQDVYKFTRDGDNRRIVAGTVDSGKVAVGDHIIFYPSGKASTLKTIEEFNREPQTKKTAGEHAGFTLEEQIYISRGEIATRNGEPKPKISSRIRTKLFWLGRNPMLTDKEYYIKIGSQKVRARLEKIHTVLDASTLERSEKRQIDRHDVAEITLKTEKAIAFDLSKDMAITSRFVIVDDYEIAGGGIITEAEEDQQKWIRDKVIQRNTKWIQSDIPKERRAEKYSQKASLILITGERESGRKGLARELEQRLFEDGKYVYYLGLGSILYGVDADIKEEGKQTNREEHLRRMAEIAHIMLDSGVILIVTAIELTQAEINLIQTIIGDFFVETIWTGDCTTTDVVPDMQIQSDCISPEAVNRIKTSLQEKGIIFMV
ncbi:MAG TPA: GTP-binding protein [Thermotogota bacterium]|nr:GTP-binding protein [Thermotogota bacterium]